MILRELRPTVSLVVFFTIALGFIVPGLFTGAAQVALPYQANGSLIVKNGQAVGSALIGQNFTGPLWFTPRPSVLDSPYDSSTSGASNLAPTSAALLTTIQQRVAAYLKAYGPGVVPADAVTSSASGLDPDISLENALRQAPAIAQARHLPAAAVTALVQAQAHLPALGLIGTAHVNVLQLNLALDGLSSP
jgi:K+-transporting ATPase ATPase C chain